MALASVQLRSSPPSDAAFHNRSLYRCGSSASSESSVKSLAGHVGRLTLKKKKTAKDKCAPWKTRVLRELAIQDDE